MSHTPAMSSGRIPPKGAGGAAGAGAPGGGGATGSVPPATVGWLSLPPMRYPNAYVWFVFFSALDIMLTWAILRRSGREVNPVADLVIQAWGLNGAIVFKFSLTLLVVIVCEVVARKRFDVGRKLAITAVVISASPVCWSMLLLLVHTLRQQ